MSIESRESAVSALAILGAVMMGLSWLVPNHYPPWNSFYNESAMAVSLMLFAAASLVLRTRFSGLPIGSAVVLLLPAIPWIQSASGLLIYTGDAWISTLYLLGFGIAIAVGYRWEVSETKKLPFLLSAAAAGAALISAGLGLSQAFLGGVLGIWSLDGKPGMQAIGNLGQSNNLATLIGFGAIGLLFLSEKAYLSRGSSLPLLIFLVMGVAVTRSRTSLLFGPVILAALYVFKKRNPDVIRVSLPLVAVATVLHWLIAYAWTSFQKAMYISAAGPLIDKGIQSSRWQVWPMFFDSLRDSPWVGYGWLQTGAALYAVAGQSRPVGELFLQSHNMFLDLLLWCGYPLGLMLVSAIVAWFISRAIKVTALPSLCGMLVVTVFGIHSMLELPHHYAYFLIPVGLWMGIVESSMDGRVLKIPAAIPFLMGLACLLLIAIWRDYSSIESDFRLFRFEQLRIGTSGETPAQTSAAPFISGVSSYMRIYRYPTNKALTNEQLNELEALSRRFPYGNSLYRYALGLARSGDLNRAVFVFGKINAIFGPRADRTFRRELERQISEGQTDLLELKNALPPPPLIDDDDG